MAARVTCNKSQSFKMTVTYKAILELAICCFSDLIYCYPPLAYSAPAALPFLLFLEHSRLDPI